MKINLRPGLFAVRGTVLIVLTQLVFSAAPTRAQSYALGTTSLLEGPSAGSNSVVISVSPTNATWTATANATWLHLSAGNQGGTGSTNVIFSSDANPGTTRTGTLTIAGLPLTVTQAGSTYVATAGPLTALVSSGLEDPHGVAVDTAGNVYIADTMNTVIKEWIMASNTVTTVVSSGVSNPDGVVVDSASNIYIADTHDNAIKKWSVSTSSLTALVSAEQYPAQVALDATSNVYFTDNLGVYEWMPANSNLTRLVGDSLAEGVAVDRSGNVYYNDTLAVLKWTAANHELTSIPQLDNSTDGFLAVDGSGNLYVSGGEALVKWSAASNTVTTMVSAPYNFFGPAVDGSGNVYISTGSTRGGAIFEFPNAFVDPTAKLEGFDAGSDVLPVVLPATENLLPPFAPTSSQPWLTITGVTNGVVSFSFTANTAASNRTANITLLGQTIPVTQAPPPTLIGATMMGCGVFQFSLSNISQSTTFTVLSTTNISLPLTNWTVIGAASNISPGLFQFTDRQATNPGSYYTVRSP